MHDEQTLLHHAKKFDENALAAIFDHYYRPIYAYIYHATSHVQTAEDLTAKVFHRFLESLHNGQAPEQHLKAWLFRVVHNLVIDEARRQVFRLHDPLEDDIPAENVDLESVAEQTLITEQVQAAMHQLTLKQRAVIILRFLEGFDISEVAQILQLTVGAVKAQQHRALETLRRHLASIYEGELE